MPDVAVYRPPQTAEEALAAMRKTRGSHTSIAHEIERAEALVIDSLLGEANPDSPDDMSISWRYVKTPPAWQRRSVCSLMASA